jgi:hypothetical protein
MLIYGMWVVCGCIRLAARRPWPFYPAGAGGRFERRNRERWSVSSPKVKRLLLDQHPVQLPEIAVVRKPLDHVRRDRPALSGSSWCPDVNSSSSIGACQRSLEACLEKVARFAHDRARSAAVRVAVDQPEELRQLFGHAASAAAQLLARLHNLVYILPHLWIGRVHLGMFQFVESSGPMRIST